MHSESQIFERAADLARRGGGKWPMAISRGVPIASEWAWKDEARDADVRDNLAAQLDALEAEAATAAERSAGWAADDRRREEAARPAPELEGQLLIEAEARHQEFVARRPERIEALLERIVAALEKR